MTGIFQLFDRQHITTGRRITNHSHNRIPTGSHINNGNLGGETNNGKYCSKNVNDKQRVSMESSRASFSSSSSSSTFSSVDCNKPARLETPSLERNIFSETSSKEQRKTQPNASPKLGQPSLDFRDVVKDSIYKEARALSAKTTTKEEAVNHVVKHRNSPRPFQLSESWDGSHEVGINGKSRVPTDFNESLRLLGKLREGPGSFNDNKELPRSSYEVRDGSSFSVTKDAPRFSYDGREIPRSSIESRDSLKSITKLRELPRLSLDSMEGSMKRTDCGPKSNSILKDVQRDNGKSKVTSSPQKELGSHKQRYNVVAKLMGLEVMPSSNIPTEGQRRLTKTYPDEDHDSFSRSSERTTECKQNRTSSSPRSSHKEPISPKLRSSNLVMKPISSSPLPIETAPWKQPESGRGLQKPMVRNLGIPPSTPNPSPSVYDKIEKRLKELEFKQLDEDLRALKHMLDTMQAKGLLETNKEDQTSNFELGRNYDQLNQTSLDPKTRTGNRRNPQNNRPISATVKGPSPSESPIVIIKPVKHAEKSCITNSSVFPIDGFSGPHKLRNGDSVHSEKGSVNGRVVKDLDPKVSLKEPAARMISYTDKKTNVTTLKSAQPSSRSQKLPRENTLSSGRSSGSISPKLQQKRPELEKQARPPMNSSDLSKPRKQSIRQSSESGSPRGKRRPKSLNFQQTDDQMSEISYETRSLSYQGDEISLRSDSNISSASQIDIEVTSADRSAEINCIFIQQGTLSPSKKVANNLISTLKPKKPSYRLSEDGSLTEFTTVAPEQPSPVSVLDASFYRDDLPSPGKNISDSFIDIKMQNSDGFPCEEEWKPDNLYHLSGDTRPDLTSEINRKKLENVEHLVQKLRRLNSNHDESTTDYIASLCENNNPDHRYISEILIASGLLLRDLGSGLSGIQPHQSGHPINPDLFLVLEQTKTSSVFPRNIQSCEKASPSKSDQEKAHRKLVFDSVNEILERKLAFMGHLPEPRLQDNKLVGRTLNAQQLLRELCSEVEKLQVRENSNWSFDGDNNLKNILFKDVMSLSQNWAVSNGEVPGVVLDVERMVFKDLVDEIVNGEAITLARAKQSRRCRQLFDK
ncbi:protein of unknown function DUF4378 [Macleaya cordata]|uniref:DUF4378 domain-containing protein n=1 Tax=Macleaya cordata TaxID=56857 RepID=A0A200QVV4_MACCD|nr:protein of unknown function DUF4378 [Macleaya cordata]